MRDLPIDHIIPRGASLEYIEHRYGPLKEAVPCGLEGCRTPHKKGFVVVFNHPKNRIDSGRALLGHICGKREFQTGWEEAERIFRAKERAAQIRQASQNFEQRANEILPQLRAAIPRIAWQRQVRQALYEHVPWLMRLCVDAVRTTNGILGIMRNTDFVPVHKLQGPSFYVEMPALDRARELLLDIEAFLRFLGSDVASVREVGRRLDQCGDIRHRWNLVERWMQAADAALRPESMGSVLDAVGQITTQNSSLRLRGAVLEADVSRTPGSTVTIWKIVWKEIARLDGPH